MTTIYFATTNAGKLKEAGEILGIEVIGTPLEIEEIQSLDPIKVASAKAVAYYEKLQKPVLVEDVSLIFHALNSLPGPYINDFSKALRNQGLIDLLENKDDRSATAQTTLVFYDKNGQSHIFVGQMKGKISKTVEGKGGFGWDPIFTPAGYKKTLAQMTPEEKNQISMRRLAFDEFKSWLQNNPICNSAGVSNFG